MAGTLACTGGSDPGMGPMTRSAASGLALAVTTATGVVGVAVGPIGGEAFAAVQLETDRRHAEELVPLIRKVSADAGTTLSDLDVLVVDVGPGRFTGLRVGVATVRALAFALGMPVVGVTSLEVLAAGVASGVQPSVITAVIDARRGEVFQQVFDVKAGPRPEVTPRGKPVVGRAADVVIGAGGVVVGDGADQYGQVYRDHGWPVTPGHNPDAAVMPALAASHQARPGAEIEPLYLRDPDVNPNVKLRPRAVATP